MVDVTPLLQRLEQRLRTNVAAAAEGATAAPNADFPAVGVDDDDSIEGKDMDAKAVQAFFAHGGTHDCSGVARLSMAEGLIKTIGADNFDALYDTGDMPWIKNERLHGSEPCPAQCAEGRLACLLEPTGLQQEA